MAKIPDRFQTLVLFLMVITSLAISFPGAIHAENGSTNTGSLDLAFEPDPPTKLNDFSIGIRGDINFTRAINDVRASFIAGSPYILNDFIALKGFFSQGFYKGITDGTTNSNETWSGYNAFGVGVSLKLGEQLPIARPYLDFGWMGIIPNAKFTSETFAWGLYGLVGFDILFKPGDFWGFFIEIGVAGFLSGGIADKMLGDLAYGSGILIDFGFRFYL